MPCAAQTLGVTGEQEGCKYVPGFRCLETAEAALSPKERKGADKAGTDEERKFQIKHWACSLYSYSLKDDSASGETP